MTEPTHKTISHFWATFEDAASRFAAKWAQGMDEKGEAHSFWDEFLHIFCIRRRQFARHKVRAKRNENRRGFIDLFLPSKLRKQQSSLRKMERRLWGRSG